jgi:hypothetical protein
MIAIDPNKFLIQRTAGVWALTCTKCDKVLSLGDTILINFDSMVCPCDNEFGHGFAQHEISEETFNDFVCGPYGSTTHFLPPELRHIHPALIARYAELRSEGVISPPK